MRTILALFLMTGPAVHWVGEMRKVMMLGEDQGIISLDSLKDKQHLYALGPVEGLNGEITVFDSEPLIASIRDGQPFVEKTFQVKAPLLVYVQVPNWKPTPLPPNVRTLDDLDKFVAGFHLTAPFPFRITALADAIQMHIVNRQGRDVKGRAAHEAIEVKIPLTDTSADLIGFWSDRHAGIFTHMGQHLHVHGRTTDNKISGHVDSVTIRQGQLWLSGS